MKQFLILILCFQLAAAGVAQQLSYRFANPQIVYLYDYDQFLTFDVEVKADMPNTLLYVGQVNLYFNDLAFDMDPDEIGSNFLIEKGDLLIGTYPINQQKYNIDVVTITTYASQPVLNVACLANHTTPNTNLTRYNEVPTEWTSLIKIQARINNPIHEAGISFVQPMMNGTQQYAGTNPPLNYINPNLYIGPDFSNTYLQRVYSDNKGWSQYGGTIDGVVFMDWSTAANTTIWDGNATITQSDNTIAQANHLNVMPDADLTITSNKWLTVAGTLSTPDPSALIIADGGSLILETDQTEATIERTLTGGTISPTTHRYHLVSVPMHEASVFTAGDVFLDRHLWEFVAEDQSWFKITPVSHSINNKEGYLIWHEDPSYHYNISGKLNAADVTLPAQDLGISGDGNSYRLVPNPYTSALEWETPAGYDAAVYFFNAATGNYVTFVDGVPQPAIFPLGQSGFIKKSTPGGTGEAITIHASKRQHNAQALYKNLNLPANTLQLSASTDFSQDETYVRFHKEATSHFDGELDALKIKGFGAAPQLFTVINEQDYAINTLEPLNETLIIPLHFEMSKDARVTFQASGLETFISGAAIFLEDLLLNEMIDLMQQTTYDFDHEKEFDADRFRLHFMGVLGTEAMAHIRWNVWSHGKYVYISAPQLFGQMAQVEFFDLLGNRILNERLAISSPSILYAGEVTRVIVVRITSGAHVYTTRLMIF